MNYSDYHERYQEFLAGHMPGRLAGEAILGAGLLATAVPSRTPTPTTAVTANSLNTMTFAANRTAHIFRNARGHLLDTPTNRQLLVEVANDRSLVAGTDRFGNSWSARTRPGGTQVWTASRNGEIINGGVNQTPRSFNPQTGFANPEPPRR